MVSRIVLVIIHHRRTAPLVVLARCVVMSQAMGDGQSRRDENARKSEEQPGETEHRRAGHALTYLTHKALDIASGTYAQRPTAV